MMEAKAWHCSHDYFIEAAGFRNEPPPKVTLGVTHFELPVKYQFEDIDLETIDNTVRAKILSQCFRFFNWVDDEFAAPDEINECARLNYTHASMSVGDIVEWNGEFWACRPMGWERLHESGLHGNQLVALRPEVMDGKPWPDDII